MWIGLLLTRLRLLPLTLVAASALLAIKLFGIGAALEGGAPRGLSGYSPIQAAHAESGDKKPSAGQPAAAQARPAAGEAVQRPAVSQPAPSPRPAAGDKPEPSDRTAAVPSASEIELLQQLARRRDALNDRARDLDRREDLLRAADTRLAEKIEEMRILESNLQKALKSYEGQEEAKIKSLVKIYENMKPKDAARIFAELDMDTLLPVAERMNERKLAPVMAELDPAKAKQMTEQLAKVRRMVSNTRSPG